MRDMSTELNRIKILEIHDRTVRFSAALIDTFNVDTFFETPAFALMVLHDAAREATDAPIAQQVSLDQLTDEKWLRANVDRFIESLEIVESTYESKPPVAIYRCVVTAAELLVGIAPGTELDSAAYDV